MAKKGREQGGFCDVAIFEVSSMFVRHQCAADILGTTVVRKVKNSSTSYARRDVAQNSLFITPNMLCNLTMGESPN